MGLRRQRALFQRAAQGGLEMLLFALIRSREPRLAVDLDAAKSGIRL
jgi:hypothetical protein